MIEESNSFNINDQKDIKNINGLQTNGKQTEKQKITKILDDIQINKNNSYEQQKNSIIQSKNIPKLYGNNFINFMKQIKPKSHKVIIQSGISIQQFNKKLDQWKKNIKTIKGIRQMWIEAYNSQAKIFRILCNLFLRKHMLHYIFNSKIQLRRRALKYRYKFLQGVKNPKDFNLIKQF